MSNGASDALSAGVLPGHRVERVLALQCDDVAARVQSDVGGLFDAPGEVARHRGGEPCTAHQDVHMAGGSGEKRGRLTCRVAPAYHDHFVSFAALSLDEGGTVIDSDALEARQIGYIEFAVLDAGRDHDRAGAY